MCKKAIKCWIDTETTNLESSFVAVIKSLLDQISK